MHFKEWIETGKKWYIKEWYKASVSGIPECFLTLNETGKQPVPNAGTESGPGMGCSQMLGTGNFPDFFGKYPVPGKWHSVTQTSNLAHCVPLQSPSHLGWRGKWNATFLFCLSGRQAVIVLHHTTCSFSGHKKWQKIGYHFVFLFTSRLDTYV